MKLLEGLQENTAVKVGDNYIVCLPQGTYEINGERVQVPYQGGQVTMACEGLIDIAIVTPATKVVDHYKGVEGKTYSIKEREDAVREFYQYYDEDLEQRVFPSLEVEFEVRNRLEPILKAEAVYKETPEYLDPYPLVKVVGEMADTGSEFIQQSYAFGKAGYGKDGVYRIQSLPVMEDELYRICEEKGWAYDVPAHSGLRYAKVCDKYVFREDTLFVKGEARVFASLEEAKAYEKECRHIVRKEVLAKMADWPINQPLLGEVITKLESIETKAQSLNVYTKSQSDKRALLSWIRGLKDTLTKAALEE